MAFVLYLYNQQVSVHHLYEVVLAGSRDTKVNQKILVPPPGAPIPLGQPAQPSMAGFQASGHGP
jgi:hypothetical protein